MKAYCASIAHLAIGGRRARPAAAASRRLVVATCAIALAAGSARAQTKPEPIPVRPDAILQEPPHQLQSLPELGAPEITIRQPKPAFVGGDIKVKPSGFRFTGNTLLPEAELQARVAGLVGKTVDLNTLAAAAASLRQLYAANGYVLTDVYLPEQQFSTTGGVVEFAVVEARVGKVSVHVAEGSGVSQAFATALAQAYLESGALISQYMLDKPVLLLRDMPGTDAEATVAPGMRPGEADIEITVSPHGPRFEPYLLLDNMGLKTEGEYRLAAGAVVNAPFGLGDVLAARVQGTNVGGNVLGRVSYGLAIGSLATKLIAAYTQSDYRLGGAFASLDATGRADIASLSAIQPLVRGRSSNLYGSLSVEDKTLTDKVGQRLSELKTHVALGRIGVLGNHSDRTLAGGSTSLAVSLSPGDVRLQPEVQALDALPSGPHVAGRFYKLNLEFQRVQYLAERSSIAVNVAGQYASKNLVSAEKFYLGGPQGVVGYPIGEGTGDQGFTFALEYRYLTGWRIADEGVSLTAFYNNGWVQRDRVRNSTTLNTATTDNSVVLDSVGIGALFGAEGNYVATFALAARLGGPVPSSGNPNSRGRLWFSLQKWF